MPSTLEAENDKVASDLIRSSNMMTVPDFLYQKKIIFK